MTSGFSGSEFVGTGESFSGLGKVSLPPVKVSQVQHGYGVGGPLLQRLLEIADGFIALIVMRGDHAEIVPGFGILGP